PHALYSFPTRRSSDLEPIPESFSFDVLHHNEAAALVLDDFVDRADVRMIQPRRRPGLAHQAFGIVHKEPTAKKFQRDLAIEVCRSEEHTSELQSLAYL